MDSVVEVTTTGSGVVIGYGRHDNASALPFSCNVPS